MIFPKQGFSGFPNEAKNLINYSKNINKLDLNIALKPNENDLSIDDEWKVAEMLNIFLINQKYLDE